MISTYETCIINHPNTRIGVSKVGYCKESFYKDNSIYKTMEYNEWSNRIINTYELY